MRVHVFSDLHLEFGPLELSRDVRSGALAELVLLAGDIHTKRRGPSWAAKTFSQPVAMIAGNHESYGDSLYAVIAAGRKSAEAASVGRRYPVRSLEQETWVLSSAGGTPIRIIAATLWTDFELFGSGERSEMMAHAQRRMNDFMMIRIRDDDRNEVRQVDPSDILRIHRQSRHYIRSELERSFDGVTIVMSHHAPSLKSVPSRRLSDPTTAAYASDLEDLIEATQPNLWVHGHIHTSSDYKIGATRVICNPRGYVPFELNRGFDPDLVVEIA